TTSLNNDFLFTAFILPINMCLTPQNLSFTLPYIVTTSRHIRAHHKTAPPLQLTIIFFHGIQ
ncbi:hypothetical protein, partial [Klebsiella pneumoniae]|uniref:hypothetical protein n=1 Tax=Klebsiella pneumoniae TaxID=573 RepID=UPI000E344CBB